MFVRSVSTQEYDVDIRRLLERRLNQTQCHLGLYLNPGDENIARAELADEKALDAWCSAVAELLVRDLSHFELARLVNDLPLSLLEKQQVLPEAIKNSRSSEQRFGVKRALLDHFADHENLVLEGFMRFRMQDALSFWALCIDRVAEEMQLEAEYSELMRILGAFAELQSPKIKEVSLCVNPDGSYTLTDDSDVRIDYEARARDGVIDVLVGLAPERITVYDLSGGKNDRFNETLSKVFAGRIKIYR